MFPSPVLSYSSKFFGTRNFTYTSHKVYPTLHSHRTESSSKNEWGSNWESSRRGVTLCHEVFLKQLTASCSKASKSHTVITWLRLRGCTPFVTTRCDRYPVGVIQHPDDCPLTEATGLVLLVPLRMPERFQKLNPFFPLTLHILW